jgi:hypothetical protein
MTVESLLEQYQGQIVPKAYNAGYLALSYLISLVGAASTLELINRRSWFNGISNQYARRIPLPSDKHCQDGLLIQMH